MVDGSNDDGVKVAVVVVEVMMMVKKVADSGGRR